MLKPPSFVQLFVFESCLFGFIVLHYSLSLIPLIPMLHAKEAAFYLLRYFCLVESELKEMKVQLGFLLLRRKL